MPSPSEYQAGSPTEGAGRNVISRAKARKAAATGGGRAWTEEEVSLISAMGIGERATNKLRRKPIFSRHDYRRCHTSI